VHPGDKPSSGWPLGFFVADDYRLSLPADTPPLTLQAARRAADERGLVPLAEGGDWQRCPRCASAKGLPLALASVPASKAIAWGGRGWSADQWL
jgi:hypothetical protein